MLFIASSKESLTSSTLSIIVSQSGCCVRPLTGVPALGVGVGVVAFLALSISAANALNLDKLVSCQIRDTVSAVFPIRNAALAPSVFRNSLILIVASATPALSLTTLERPAYNLRTSPVVVAALSSNCCITLSKAEKIRCS